MSRWVRVAWMLLRLPALGVLIYLLRHPILDRIEQWIDVLIPTRFVIDLLSTPLMRLAIAVALLGGLLLIAAAVRGLRPVAGYLVAVSAGAALVLVALAWTDTSVKRGAIVLVLLAANLIPVGVFGLVRRFPRASDAVMLAAVGIVELFMFREYLQWLRNQCRGSAATSGARGLTAAIPALVIAPLVCACIVRGDRLLAYEQQLRMPSTVQVLERELSINWIELDPSGAFLYATGHALPYVRRYDLRNAGSPLTSDAWTAGSQSFAYDAQARELYAFNTTTHRLIALEEGTLAGKRTHAVPQLSPGDPWIVVDPISDTLTVVSEADEQTGHPFVVLNRSTGELLDEADLDAGNVLRHPREPWLYLSFFRRRNELLLYDLQTRTVTRRAAADPRAERMVFWEAANEVLVTSPMESRIMRFDADSLEAKGFIPVNFGVRALALDERRGVLVAGNIATGLLSVLQLPSGENLRSYYLGPWLRTIALDVATGTAYVSSNGALYRAVYAPAGSD